MRINEYNNLEDFIFEYSKGTEFSWQNKEKRRRYMGIEFSYHHCYYRMCREPIDEKKRPILDNGKRALYDVMLINCGKDGYPGLDHYDLIGWYADLDDVLDHCIIEGRPFKEVIMDDDTEILGKD